MTVDYRSASPALSHTEAQPSDDAQRCMVPRCVFPFFPHSNACLVLLSRCHCVLASPSSRPLSTPTNPSQLHARNSPLTSTFHPRHALSLWRRRPHISRLVPIAQRRVLSERRGPAAHRCFLCRVELRCAGRQQRDPRRQAKGKGSPRCLGREHGLSCTRRRQWRVPQALAFRLAQALDRPNSGTHRRPEVEADRAAQSLHLARSVGQRQQVRAQQILGTSLRRTERPP